LAKWSQLESYFIDLLAHRRRPRPTVRGAAGYGYDDGGAGVRQQIVQLPEVGGLQ
jgi:hypothetical protein